MSSFRRSAPRSSQNQSQVQVPSDATIKRTLSGTKPFVNGQTLVSTGLSQLDTIVGGGWFLGTIVLLDVPSGDIAAGSTRLVEDFHRYFVAEGVASGQGALVVCDDAPGFVPQLPLELSSAQKQVKTQITTGTKDDQLTIAWQYQKYIAGDSTGASQRFCHSFDLSRPMHQELLHANPPTLFDFSGTTQHDDSNDCVLSVYRSLLGRLKEEITRQGCGRVLRVSVQDLGSPIFGPPSRAHMSELFTFIRSLHQLCSSARNIVFQLSGHFYAFPIEFRNQLKHIADYVLEVKSFVGENDMLPGELLEFNGLLDIKKLARCHALACHSMDAVKYGIKRERRKMKIEKFHLPPEGSRSSNDKDKTSGTTRSNLVTSSTSRPKGSGSGCGDHSHGVDPFEF